MWRILCRGKKPTSTSWKLVLHWELAPHPRWQGSKSLPAFVGRTIMSMKNTKIENGNKNPDQCGEFGAEAKMPGTASWELALHDAKTNSYKANPYQSA